MGLGNGINDVAVHGGSVWLVTSGQNVILLDARDLRVQGSESLGAIPVALGIAGGSVWIAGQNPTGPGAAVFRLHEATGRVLQTIVLGGRNDPPSLYATNGDGAIWVADYESGSVLRIDPKTGAIVSRIYRMLQNQWTADRAADLRSVIDHAETAVACDAMDANGYLFRSLASSLQGKREDALTDLRRAVELNPSLPVARSLLGQFLGMAGRTEEGLRELDYAIRLSPRDPQLWSFHAGRGVVLFVARRYEDARAASDEAIAIERDAASAFSMVAATSALLGDLPRAQAALDETLLLWPNLSVVTLRTVIASVPEAAVEEYLRGLRLPGWSTDDGE